MLAAEEDFDAGGPEVPRGLDHRARRRSRAGWSRCCANSGCRPGPSPPSPQVKTHELDVPRIGYVHSWTRTQDEGWWRAALDTYGVPYTYFADQKLREGNLRAKYDVILFPHVGGTAVAQVNGIARNRQRAAAVQEDRRDAEPWRARLRATTFAAAWASRAWPSSRSSCERGRYADHRRIDGDDLSRVRPDLRRDRRSSRRSCSCAGSILRAQDCRSDEPARVRLRRDGAAGVFQPGAGIECRWRRPAAVAAVRRRAAPNAGLGQNITPNATPLRHLAVRAARPAPPSDRSARAAAAEEVAALRQIARRASRPARSPTVAPARRDAVPAESRRMLLSGTLANGQLLAEPRRRGGRAWAMATS